MHAQRESPCRDICPCFVHAKRGIQASLSASKIGDLIPCGVPTPSVAIVHAESDALNLNSVKFS